MMASCGVFIADMLFFVTFAMSFSPQNGSA